MKQLKFRFWNDLKRREHPYNRDHLRPGYRARKVGKKFMMSLMDDICGVQPMTGPTGLILTIKPRYSNPPTPEEFELISPPGTCG